MKSRIIVAGVVGLLATSLAAAAPARVELQQQVTLPELLVQNLTGNITLVQSSSDRFEITAHVVANAEPAATADALARSVKLDLHGNRLDVVLPTRTHAAIYTAEAPKVHWPLRATLHYLDREVVLTRDRSNGIDLRVDLHIAVPANARLELKNYFGYVHAEGVDAQLALETNSGTISSARTRGELSASTGSSDIHVAFHRGKLTADTGSGNVYIEGAEGELSADTGSGDIHVAHSSGSLSADTGSGDVNVEVFAGSVEADTGSGDVRTAQVTNVPKFHADTGSGDVYLEGDLAALQDFDIDTGAGDVTVISSTEPSLRLSIETGAGDLKLTGAALVHATDADDNDEQIITLGVSGADAKIETGSGDITLSFPATAASPLSSQDSQKTPPKITQM